MGLQVASRLKKEPFKFSQWASLCADYVIPHKIVNQLPQEFMTVLKADGIRLQSNSGQDSDDGSANDDTESDEESQAQDPEVEISEDFRQQIADQIRFLGGAVFPKLNGRSAIDATFMVPSIRCMSLDEIILVLKGSSRVLLPDNLASANMADLELVLYKHIEVNESMEFRCLIKDHKLRGITQRKVHHFWDYLSGMKAQLLERISTFLQEKVINKFEMTNYVVDLLVQDDNRIVMLDVSPLDSTNWLLFQDEDLLALEAVELRLVESSQHAQANSNLTVPVESRYPVDMWSLGGSSFDDKIQALRDEIKDQG